MAKIVGVDAGEYEVKLVELDGSYKKPRITKVSVERICQETTSSADEQHAMTEAESLRDLLESAGIGRDGITLGFPCREAVLRTLTVPFTGNDRIRKVIKFEAEGEIHSHNVDDMVVDFHTIVEADGETRVLVAAVPKQALRTTLEALERAGIEPEIVDLDTMALFRLAEWAGVFATGNGESNDTGVQVSDTPKSRLVLDLGARSSRVLIVSAGHLTDMRALRSGTDSIAQEIAVAKDLDLETARNAVRHCLSTGTDYDVPQGAGSAASAAELEDEVVIEDEAEAEAEAGAEAGAEAEAGEAGTSTALTPPALITHESVVGARDRYLQKLCRELRRFLTSVPNIGEIEQVHMTGGGSQLQGVEEVLEEVFGCHAEPLRFLDELQHGLDAEEARRLEPRLAVAVGLALGQLGGARGFNFRQEDLVFTRRFDRIKLPLAIACMLFLFFLCFQGLKLRRELTNLSRQYGAVMVPKKQKTNTGRRAGRGTRTNISELPRFTGYLGRLVWPNISWAHANLGKEYPALLTKLVNTPVFERIPAYNLHLRKINVDLLKDAGHIAGFELDSGAAVLQEFAEVIEKNIQELGRILVCDVELRLPPGNRGRSLRIKVAFRGPDFRVRQKALRKGFEDRFADKDSAFQKMDQGAEELFRNGEGCFYTLKVDIKPKVPVR